MMGWLGGRRPPVVRTRPRFAGGFTLVEALVVLAIAMALLAVGLPVLWTGVDEYRTASAARYLAARFRLARMEAVRRSAAVGLRFERDGATVRYAAFLDGNLNGVRTPDITRGVDLALDAPERIGDQFPGVSFGLHAAVPAIGAATATSGDRDPLQIGRSRIMTFTPDGTASSGTLYVRGRGATQFAVRVLGATGRTRVLRFDTGTRAWIER